MRIFLALAVSSACHGGSQTPPASTSKASQPSRTKGKSEAPLLSSLLELRSAPAIATLGEDNGNRMEMVKSVVEGPLGPWTKIPAPDGAHPVVCDMAWFQGAVWASFGNKTISTDGAQIHSWQPERGWKLEFDWDRGGAPGVTHEQGGQGIARLRVIDEKLYAPGADAPNYGGFGISGAPFEGYVFVADEKGFGALTEGQLPPKETLLLPLAFHVFDIIKYGGELVASGGTVGPPGSKSRYPGGLFVTTADGLYWPKFFPGAQSRAGVVRTTFMHRFRGRLYMGFQNNERRARWDLGVLEGSPSGDATLVLGRVTAEGGWKTRQFASDRNHLYWIASMRTKPSVSRLFSSDDGLDFKPVTLPEGAGEAHDVLAHGGSLLVLADGGLFRRQGTDAFEQLLKSPKGAPFQRRDGFCTSPLHANPLGLFAGSTDGSGLYWSTRPAGVTTSPGG